MRAAQEILEHHAQAGAPTRTPPCSSPVTPQRSPRLGPAPGRWARYASSPMTVTDLTGSTPSSVSNSQNGLDRPRTVSRSRSRWPTGTCSCSGKATAAAPSSTTSIWARRGRTPRSAAGSLSTCAPPTDSSRRLSLPQRCSPPGSGCSPKAPARWNSTSSSASSTSCPASPSSPALSVLRQSLAEGVRQGLFGLASGAAWDAEDSVLRFAEFVDPSEIQFQPGTWLIRAAVIKELIAARKPLSHRSTVTKRARPSRADTDATGPFRPVRPIPEGDGSLHGATKRHCAHPWHPEQPSP